MSLITTTQLLYIRFIFRYYIHSNVQNNLTRTKIFNIKHTDIPPDILR